MRYMVYKAIKKIRLFRNFVEQIETRMEILYPGNRHKIIIHTELELIKIAFMDVLVFVAFMLYGNWDIVYMFMGICVMYVLAKCSINASYDKLELKLLHQFEKFIQDVRFQFKYDEMIEEALYDALQGTEDEMALQGNLIYESLNQASAQSDSYIEIAPNHFFMTFYALCETVKNYGDKVIDGKSSFLTNLSYLKEDVNIEILKRERINAMFMGLMGVCIFPLFAIKPICIWGIQNIPGLKFYYEGIAGNITNILITVLTVVIVNVIMKLRYPLEYENHKSRWIEWILSKKPIDRILMKRISKNYRHYYNMDSFLKSIVYKYNIKEFMVYRFGMGMITFLVSSVLMIRVGLYQKGVWGIVLSITLILFCTVTAYYYEFLMLMLRRRLLKLNREEEVVRYQSVIMILMNMDRITLETILEWMEKFAVVFKSVIEKMTDSIIYKGNTVFENAKNEVQFLPFERLLDCFIASDRIGIRRAFSDIVSDRLYYVEKHKQENEIMIGNKALIAKFIAFIPMCMVICFVLVVPFVYQGLQQLWAFQLI